MRASSHMAEPDTWIHKVLGDQHFQEAPGFFAFWYRHTSPPNPPSGASFELRDRVRRGRIASASMLFLTIVLLLVALVALLGPNKQIITIVYTLSPLIAVCIVCNRRGWVNVVGILLTSGLVGGMCLTLFTTAAHGGLTPNDKDILYLLFFDELFVAALLPINAVFLVAGLNMAISLFMLSFAHHTPAFESMLATSYSSIVFRLCQIHVIVPGILWILVNTNRASIKRADRAEELLRLQRDIAQMEREKASEKQALEESIDLITATHARVANGDLDARVPLISEKTFLLWGIAGQLNNLLARYQNARQELQRHEFLIEAFQKQMADDPSLREMVVRHLQERQLLHQR